MKMKKILSCIVLVLCTQFLYGADAPEAGGVSIAIEGIAANLARLNNAIVATRAVYDRVGEVTNAEDALAVLDILEICVQNQFLKNDSETTTMLWSCIKQIAENVIERCVTDRCFALAQEYGNNCCADIIAVCLANHYRANKKAGAFMHTMFVASQGGGAAAEETDLVRLFRDTDITRMTPGTHTFLRGRHHLVDIKHYLGGKTCKADCRLCEFAQDPAHRNLVHQIVHGIVCECTDPVHLGLSLS